MHNIEFDIATSAPDEVAAIVALVNAAYRGESSRPGWTTEADLLDGQRTDAEQVSSLINSVDSIILLARLDGALTGCMHLQKQDSTAHLGMFVVDPQQQGQGLGKQFLAMAEKMMCETWGCCEISMTVISVRDELIAFYERHGYRRTGRYIPFPDDVRFGIPKVKGLQFEVLVKRLGESE